MMDLAMAAAVSAMLGQHAMDESASQALLEKVSPMPSRGRESAAPDSGLSLPRRIHVQDQLLNVVPPGREA